MTLRRKTLAIIGLVLVFPIVILYMASQTILLPITLIYLNADPLAEDFRLAAESLSAN